MTLSNTDVPKYYAEFREKVVQGEIPICHEIEMEMNRIDALIANPGIYCDNDAVEGWIDFCENELTLTDGSPLHLLDSFKLWGEQVYAWYYFVDRSVYVPDKTGGGGHYINKRIKKRLTTKQYLIVSRGNAKSLYGTCHHAFRQMTNMSTGTQITTAPTMKQADEIMSPYKTAIVKARGPLMKFYTQGRLPGQSGGNRDNQVKLASTKKGIENFISNTLLEVRPMSIDKLQGLRITLATVDEWLSGDIREDVITALEQGSSKEQGPATDNDYLIVAMSSEGTVRNSAGDNMKTELMKILKGETPAPYTSIFYYKQDDLDELNHPETWMKSNPNVGITVAYDTLQRDLEKAETNSIARNDILAKRFGIPMEGHTFFFTYGETLLHQRRDFWQMPCAMGADLSQGDDFCAFTFMFPLRGEAFGVKTRNYISEYTLSKLPTATRGLYEKFMQEGSLHVMGGTVLDLERVYDDLYQYIIESDYDVRCFGYDPYQAKSFVERWSQDNGEYGIVKVPQGAKTESVPLGELKKLAEQRKLIFDEEMMKFTMGNCIIDVDNNGNRKLYKAKRQDKIDGVAAMMDAFIAYKMNRDSFE
jgi:phage terminase large subunit-like protein